MPSFLIQTERFIRISLGFVIFPILLIFLLFKAGIQEYNFSGLFQLTGFRKIMTVGSLVLLGWLLRCFSLIREKSSLPFTMKKILFLLFPAAYIFTIFIPYEEGNSLSSSLHLISAYTAFTVFNILLFSSLKKTSQKYFYDGLLILFILLCITDGEISGAAELIYALGSLFLITALSIEQ